jgi:hypothetical protein
VWGEGVPKARGGEAGRATGYTEKIIGETTALRPSSTTFVRSSVPPETRAAALEIAVVACVLLTSAELAVAAYARMLG